MKRTSILAAGLLFSTQAAYSQTLDCKQITATQPTGGAEHVEATVSLSDDDYRLGYRVTGGGCVQTPEFGEHYVRVKTLLPTPRGFTCGLIGITNEGMRVMPYAIACRVMPSPLGRVAKFSSNGLGGSIVTIARTSDDVSSNYTAVIPYSFRVCNLQGGTEIGIYFGVGSDNVTNYNLVPYHSCLEVDRPKQVMFHTTKSVSIDVAGKYELFKPGTFAVTKVVGSPTKVPSQDLIKVSAETTETATCVKSTDPNAPNWGSCKAPSLTGGKNYRVCFDNGYSNQPPGADDYPGGLVPMVLDSGLIAKPIGGTPNEFIYNFIAPQGCRDLFKVNQVNFVVTDNTWNNQAVSSITYRYQEILP